MGSFREPSILQEKKVQWTVTQTSSKTGFSSRKQNRKEVREKTSGNERSSVKAGTGRSKPSTSTALIRNVVVALSINIKEHYPSKSTRCLTIQNSSGEHRSSHEAEARSFHHIATDCTFRSPATDRLTQSQKVTEMPKSNGQSMITGQITKFTGHRTITVHKHNTNVTLNTGHEATDNQQTPDISQLPDMQQTWGFHQTPNQTSDIHRTLGIHRTPNRTQAIHQTLDNHYTPDIHRTPDISQTNEKSR